MVNRTYDGYVTVGSTAYSVRRRAVHMSVRVIRADDGELFELTDFTDGGIDVRAGDGALFRLDKDTVETIRQESVTRQNTHDCECGGSYCGVIHPFTERDDAVLLVDEVVKLLHMVYAVRTQARAPLKQQLPVLWVYHTNAILSFRIVHCLNALLREHGGFRSVLQMTVLEDHCTLKPVPDFMRLALYNEKHHIQEAARVIRDLTEAQLTSCLRDGGVHHGKVNVSRDDVIIRLVPKTVWDSTTPSSTSGYLAIHVQDVCPPEMTGCPTTIKMIDAPQK